MDLSAPFRLPSVLRKGQAIGSLGTSPRASYGGWLKSKETGNTALLDVVSSQSQELFEAAPGLAPPSSSLTLDLHWSPDGRISRMVRRQTRVRLRLHHQCPYFP